MKKVIAVIDDDPSVEKLLGKITGYESRCFSRVEAFMTVPQGEEFEAIFLDIHLDDEKNGLSYLADIRNKWPWSVIFVVTSSKSEGLISEAFNCGANEFLRKPFEPEEVRSRLKASKAMLERLRQQQHIVFGDLKLQHREQLLICSSRSGEVNSTKLSPKQYAVFLTLIKEQGSLVSKKTFLSRVWNSVIVSDKAIEKQIHDARKILKSLKSEIALENKYGSGFAFTKQESRPVKLEGNDPANSCIGRALVVDDNKVNVAFSRKILERLCFEVYEAFDGQQAFDLGKDKFFDLVLIDYQMPKMNGADAAKLLKNDPASLCQQSKIIGMLGDHDSDLASHCLESGMNETIYKPIDLEKLQNTESLRAYKQQKVSQKKKIAEYFQEVLPNLNSAYLASIIDDHDQEFLQNLLQIFLDNYLEAFLRLKSSQDLETVQRLSHKLRGMCENIGEKNLAQQFARMEALNRPGQREGLLARLEADLSKSITQMEIYLQSKKTADSA